MRIRLNTVRISTNGGTVSHLRTNSWVRSTGLAIAVLVVGIGKYGFDVFPSWPFYFDITTHWQAPQLTYPANYLYSSPVSAWTAGLIGITTYQSFFVFHAVLVAIALVLPLYMPAIRTSIGQLRLMFMAIVGGGVLPALLAWIMDYDPVTLIAIGIAALARNYVVSWLGWILLAFNHSSFGMVSLAIWVPLIFLLNDRANWRNVMIRAAGAVVSFGIGTVLINRVVNDWGGAISRIEWIKALGLDYFTGPFLLLLPLVLFSALGISWALLADEQVRKTWAVRLLLIAALAGSLVLPMLADDKTRVIALSTALPLYAWIAHSEQLHGATVIDSLWRKFGFVAVILPVMVIWGDKIVYAGWKNLTDFSMFWNGLIGP